MFGDDTMPIIAILSQVDDEKNIKLAAPYVEAVESCGGLPIIFPFTECEKTIDSLIELCDGFLFSGGADIEPELYGEKKSEFCESVQIYRDKLELAVFRKVFASGKPIMGICRGAQLINVALGGTLYQDIPTEYKTSVAHRQTEAKDMPSHSVLVKSATPLAELAGGERMLANSFHHQALKRLGEGIEVMAESDDGIVEAVYRKDYPYLRAYQWHPERLFLIDTENKMLFEDFIKAANKSK